MPIQGTEGDDDIQVVEEWETSGETTVEALGGDDVINFRWDFRNDDTLRGGAGTDRFYFDTHINDHNHVDELVDFTPADDWIMLDRDIFDGLPNGVLSASAFRLGTSAQDSSDRIIDDQATGRIFHDPDGAGGSVGGAVRGGAGRHRAHPRALLRLRLGPTRAVTARAATGPGARRARCTALRFKIGAALFGMGKGTVALLLQHLIGAGPEFPVRPFTNRLEASRSHRST